MRRPCGKTVAILTIVLVGFCCCCLLCLCGAPLHCQGVTKQLSHNEDRQLKQYLQAQGSLWHKQQRLQVLSQLQQQLWQEWQRRIPGLSTLTKAEQLTAIQRIVSAPAEDITLWLQALPAKPTTQDWLDYLQAHQHIRNAT